jgi:hypothetical protein
VGRGRTALVGVAAAAAAGVALAAAVGGAGGQAPQPPTPADLQGIPAGDADAIVASEGWQRLTRPPLRSLRHLGSAHPGAKSIRVSVGRAALVDRRGRQRFPYPRGTVIVKTARSGGELGLVAIMRKVRAGRSAASWRYVEYTRGGGPAFTKVGGGQGLCRGCHVSAADEQRSDWVFYRLR